SAENVSPGGNNSLYACDSLDNSGSASSSNASTDSTKTAATAQANTLAVVPRRIYVDLPVGASWLFEGEA
ncbi:MAG: hypothetical protein WA982_13075, partial [Rubrobacteraceae bacterium]